MCSQVTGRSTDGNIVKYEEKEREKKNQQTSRKYGEKKNKENTFLEKGVNTLLKFDLRNVLQRRFSMFRL